MHLLFRIGFLCLLCGTLVFASLAQTTQANHSSYQAEFDNWHYPTQLGSGEGAHSLNQSRGVGVLVHYTGDQLTNVAGGLEQRGSYLHNLDVLLGLNADELIGWKGARFLVHVINNNGGEFNSFVGASQQVSNITAPKITKLYQAWIQQDAMCGRLSFLAGLYDLNSEFYLTRTSSLFLNSSFLVGKELSQPALYNPGVFPNSAAAFRIKFRPSPRWSFQCVVMDGMPGTKENRDQPSMRMSTDEGAFFAGEVAFNWKGVDEEAIGKGKYTIGSWMHTKPVRSLEIGDLYFERNYGFYLLAEQQVCGEPEDGRQGLSLFLRAGVANAHVNQFDFDAGGGFVYTGLIRGRDSDKLGVAATHANNSSAYKAASRLNGQPYENYELALEVTYLAQLTSWLSIQPDVQHIIHPSTMPGVESATVVGSRIRVGLE